MTRGAKEVRESAAPPQLDRHWGDADEPSSAYEHSPYFGKRAASIDLSEHRRDR